MDEIWFKVQTTLQLISFHSQATLNIVEDMVSSPSKQGVRMLYPYDKIKEDFKGVPLLQEIPTDQTLLQDRS